MPTPQPSPITVVSGLPRSGTSMMMRMLTAGGMEAVTDGVRQADTDNPRGYFELEAVKRLKQDHAWLAAARGNVVKVISLLLMDLPEAYSYKVVFMERPMAEILASQRQMLLRRGEQAAPETDERMAAVYEKHLAQVRHWLAQRPQFATMYVDYRGVIAEPAQYAARISDFLGGTLDATAMAAAVDAALYRQRSE